MSEIEADTGKLSNLPQTKILLVQEFQVKRYEARDINIWNDFAKSAKNATFLFNRSYMDYHADRFDDYSLLIYDDLKPIAILPAHISGDSVHSHNGLTYGGLIYTSDIKLSQVLMIFKAVLAFLQQADIEFLYIKTIPSIYHKLPSDELNYALFVSGGKLYRRDALSTIDLTKPFSISKTRKESIRRGAKNGLIIKEEPNFELFWNQVLIPNLIAKHEAAPVHSIAEIELLHKRFPGHIRHFNVYNKGEIAAGTTVFVSDNVAHPQYVSGRPDKNETGAIDFLYHHLITEVFNDKHYFDFGISNEQQGLKLNGGLVFWKESFGARTITQDFYLVETKNHTLLDTVLI